MAKSEKLVERVFNARPDTLDFRDQMYVATLYEVPEKIELEKYLACKVPVLDQGQEGACTGFGLATVAHYLLRKRLIYPDEMPVSPRMFYEMAKRYDEWPGLDYSGSSARGAMKGWHKHGVCSDECAPYNIDDKQFRLNDDRTSNALKRPLGAYYRVNHQDLVAMHSALAEVGILYATGTVHDGWNHVGEDGVIPYTPQLLGGHAFAIIAYEQRGFWIQNSWGKTWGKEGLALITYDDWLANGTDTWVARLGAPVELYKSSSIATSHNAMAGQSKAYSYSDLRPHLISLGNNGMFKAGGDYGTSFNDVQAIFKEDFPAVTEKWKKKRLLLYAHGGLVSETAAVQRLAEYRPALLAAEIYPVSFIWHSDTWSTVTNILQDAVSRRRPEGFLDSSKDFMLDRLDDALEPFARTLTGKLQWDQMKQNALLATQSETGGVKQTLQLIAELAGKYKDDFEIHLIGHSAGSIFHAPLIQLLTSKVKGNPADLNGNNGLGLTIKTCTLWAPACTVDLFKQTYLPAIKSGSIEKFTLFTLTERAEQDDNCSHIYNKSLLYLVSDAFEEQARIPFFRDGVPVLGMQKFIDKDEELRSLFKNKNCDWILSPNSAADGSDKRSTSTAHGGFDDDLPTVSATLARMLNQEKVNVNIEFASSASKLAGRRYQISNQRKA